MIKIVAVIGVVLLGGLAVFYDQVQVPKAVVAEEAAVDKDAVDKKQLPDFTFAMTNGEDLRLLDIEEPVILLHFWASWCAPCIVEFPMILDMMRKMDGKVALVAVSLDHKEDPMNRFLTKQDYEGLPVSWVWDEDFSIAYKQFLISQLPETIIVGPERFMERKIVGEYDWLGDEAIAQLTSLMRDPI